MLRYSEDGLAYLNGSETYWNQAFQMKQPLVDVNGEYVAVADQKGNIVYICNTESQQGQVEWMYLPMVS